MVKLKSVEIEFQENRKTVGAVANFEYSVSLLERVNGVEWSLEVPKQELNMSLFMYDEKTDSEYVEKRKLLIEPFSNFDIEVVAENVKCGFFVEKLYINVDMKRIFVYI